MTCGPLFAAFIEQATTAATARSDPTNPALYVFYAANMRPSLFTAFLTLTGFLFSVKTFLIINLKKELYENDGYLKEVAELRRINPGLSVFGPLRRLSTLLMVAVCVSLLASVSQMTVGLIQSNWAAVCCLGLAGLSLFTLVVVLLIMRRNLLDWFSFLENHPKHGPSQTEPVGKHEQCITPGAS